MCKYKELRNANVCRYACNIFLLSSAQKKPDKNKANTKQKIKLKRQEIF